MHNEIYSNDKEKHKESNNDNFVESLPKNPLILNEETDKTAEKVR